ncbi:MAG: phenylacetate-CoA oxygenase subunit PaaC [Gemmatimonadaceae bacterium]|nr:phenylacetate-CoA oxygenase subunit PaaC [Chitinophagaceae bacterium]
MATEISIGNLTQPINESTDQLILYTLHLADNALILGQRNAEWTGHGPVLEQDIAISNIALDLIGQARMLYQYAATLINQATNQLINHSTNPAHTEDTLAFFRTGAEYKNCLLVELPRGDWGVTVLRQFFFSTYQYFLYHELKNSADETLAAIAEKSFKEVTYHMRWSAEWVIRLGDGTEESHDRMQKALDQLWAYTGELLTPGDFETEPDGKIVVDLRSIKVAWTNKIQEVLSTATLQIPENKWQQSGGKQGRHTEHLGYILSEMQYLQRTYPNAQW